MNYSDEQKILVGDHIKLIDGGVGTVVCVCEKGGYTEEYPESEWSCLGGGLLIKTDLYGIIHFEYPQIDFSLIARRDTNPRQDEG